MILAKLSNVHSAVARELAVGIPLDKICETRGLLLSSWRNITGAPLFRAKVKELQVEIEDQMIDDHCSDPTLLTLRNESLASAKLLIEERDNYDKEDSGATSNTRIKAAGMILELNGYGRKEEAPGTTVVINLSPDKLTALKEAQGSKPSVFEADFTEESLQAEG